MRSLLKKAKDTPAGFLALTLHAHLPYVVNHGTWPHGIEWLLEAAAETYLPLLRVLRNLERDGVPANFNLNLSPILLEQLAHPIFVAEFPRYLTRKIIAAREDEAYFIQSGDLHLTETARLWGRFFTAALDDFNALGGNIVQGFRHFNDNGMIEILTCGATHGYMPLLGTDESVRAQVRTAVSTHIRHLGKRPRGIWAPECGYRPAGHWEYPSSPPAPPKPIPASIASASSRLSPNPTSNTSLSIPTWLKRAGGFPPRTTLPTATSPARRSATGPTAAAQSLPAVLRRRPLRQALRHHRLPARPQHRPPGLVRRHRLPRRRQLPRLP